MKRNQNFGANFVINNFYRVGMDERDFSRRLLELWYDLRRFCVDWKSLPRH